MVLFALYVCLFCHLSSNTFSKFKKSIFFFFALKELLSERCPQQQKRSLAQRSDSSLPLMFSCPGTPQRYFCRYFMTMNWWQLSTYMEIGLFGEYSFSLQSLYRLRIRPWPFRFDRKPPRVFRLIALRAAVDLIYMSSGEMLRITSRDTIGVVFKALFSIEVARISFVPWSLICQVIYAMAFLATMASKINSSHSFPEVR